MQRRQAPEETGVQLFRNHDIGQDPQGKALFFQSTLSSPRQQVVDSSTTNHDILSEYFDDLEHEEEQVAITHISGCTIRNSRFINDTIQIKPGTISIYAKAALKKHSAKSIQPKKTSHSIPSQRQIKLSGEHILSFDKDPQATLGPHHQEYINMLLSALSCKKRKLLIGHEEVQHKQMHFRAYLHKIHIKPRSPSNTQPTESNILEIRPVSISTHPLLLKEKHDRFMHKHIGHKNTFFLKIQSSERSSHSNLVRDKENFITIMNNRGMILPNVDILTLVYLAGAHQLLIEPDYIALIFYFYREIVMPDAASHRDYYCITPNSSAIIYLENQQIRIQSKFISPGAYQQAYQAHILLSSLRLNQRLQSTIHTKYTKEVCEAPWCQKTTLNILQKGGSNLRYSIDAVNTLASIRFYNPRHQRYRVATIAEDGTMQHIVMSASNKSHKECLEIIPHLDIMTTYNCPNEANNAIKDYIYRRHILAGSFKLDTIDRRELHAPLIPVENITRSKPCSKLHEQHINEKEQKLLTIQSRDAQYIHYDSEKQLSLYTLCEMIGTSSINPMIHDPFTLGTTQALAKLRELSPSIVSQFGDTQSIVQHYWMGAYKKDLHSIGRYFQLIFTHDESTVPQATIHPSFPPLTTKDKHTRHAPALVMCVFINDELRSDERMSTLEITPFPAATNLQSILTSSIITQNGDELHHPFGYKSEVCSHRFQDVKNMSRIVILTGTKDCHWSACTNKTCDRYVYKAITDPQNPWAIALQGVLSTMLNTSTPNSTQKFIEASKIMRNYQYNTLRGLIRFLLKETEEHTDQLEHTCGLLPELLGIPPIDFNCRIAAYHQITHNLLPRLKHLH